MLKKLTAVALAASALTACAAQQPQMSREEWLQATTRQYQGVNEQEAYAAAEKLFRLADGGDFMISHNQDAMFAVRNWSVYLVLAAAFGSDRWMVTADEAEGATTVSVSAQSSAQPVSAMPTTNGGASAYTGPMAGGAGIQGTAIYDLFWARMDYLLGKTDHWMTCAEAEQRKKEGLVWGNAEALCNDFNIKDDAPEGASEKNTAEAVTG